MSDAPLSTTGKWVTTDGRVVDSEPEEGRLLVAPGGPLSPDVQASIAAAEAAAPVAPVEPAEPEPAPEPEPEPDKPEHASKRGH